MHMKNNRFVWFDDRNCLGYLRSGEGMRNPLLSISIGTSARCNMRCPHCIYDAGMPARKRLDTKGKLKLLEDAHRSGARFLQICHDGEPLLDPSTLKLIEKGHALGMLTFMYTNASAITPQIANFLFRHEVRLGVHLDSLSPQVFDQMLGVPGGSARIYTGLRNLLQAGYDRPFERDGKLITRLCIVCTLTSLNTESIDGLKELAEFAWKNNIFFGLARLERGGRAVGELYARMKADRAKVISLLDWCSERTGINYLNAQPTPYCIGVCGLHFNDRGDAWVTSYGGSCDFTEPDGESFPGGIKVLGNVKTDSLDAILDRLWEFRKRLVLDGTLKRKLQEYESTKDTYPNGLQDCGSARTYTLFRPFYDYVLEIVNADAP